MWPGLQGNGWGWHHGPRELRLSQCCQCLLPPARVLKRKERVSCTSVCEEALEVVQSCEDICAIIVFTEVGLVASISSPRAGRGKLGHMHEAEGRWQGCHCLLSELCPALVPCPEPSRSSAAVLGSHSAPGVFQLLDCTRFKTDDSSILHVLHMQLHSRSSVLRKVAVTSLAMLSEEPEQVSRGSQAQ